MSENKTRIFNATYTNKNGQKYSSRIRINPRLVGLFLGLTFVVTVSSCTIKSLKDNDKPIGGKIDGAENEDLMAIEEIIKNHPEMLVHKSIVYHNTNNGDTLWDIAQKYNPDVDDINSVVTRIKELNQDVFGPNGILPVGATLKVESTTSLSNLDRSINILECYINDYVLQKSMAARIAKSEDGDLKEKKVFNQILYGDENLQTKLSGISQLYDNIHNIYCHPNYQPTDKIKEEYIEVLRYITREIETNFEAIGNSQAVIPYIEFESYCLNQSVNLSTNRQTIN